MICFLVLLSQRIFLASFFGNFAVEMKLQYTLIPGARLYFYMGMHIGFTFLEQVEILFSALRNGSA